MKRYFWVIILVTSAIVLAKCQPPPVEVPTSVRTESVSSILGEPLVENSIEQPQCPPKILNSEYLAGPTPIVQVPISDHQALNIYILLDVSDSMEYCSSENTKIQAVEILEAIVGSFNQLNLIDENFVTFHVGLFPYRNPKTAENEVDWIIEKENELEEDYDTIRNIALQGGHDFSGAVEDSLKKIEPNEKNILFMITDGVFAHSGAAERTEVENIFREKADLLKDVDYWVAIPRCETMQEDFKKQGYAEKEFKADKYLWNSLAYEGKINLERNSTDETIFESLLEKYYPGAQIEVAVSDLSSHLLDGGMEITNETTFSTPANAIGLTISIFPKPASEQGFVLKSFVNQQGTLVEVPLPPQNQGFYGQPGGRYLGGLDANTLVALLPKLSLSKAMSCPERVWTIESETKPFLYSWETQIPEFELTDRSYPEKIQNNEPFTVTLTLNEKTLSNLSDGLWEKLQNCYRWNFYVLSHDNKVIFERSGPIESQIAIENIKVCGEKTYTKGLKALFSLSWVSGGDKWIPVVRESFEIATVYQPQFRTFEGQSKDNYLVDFYFLDPEIQPEIKVYRENYMKDCPLSFKPEHDTYMEIELLQSHHLSTDNTNKVWWKSEDQDGYRVHLPREIIDGCAIDFVSIHWPDQPTSPGVWCDLEQETCYRWEKE